ncbi:hypothetical protein ABZ686_08195, partial [Streptomyces sp. NPDC006992]|uniref:hypothetical protein n=1 Tax=Streptomyces sp. NPDC006992 TaxID=3155601 RepID=UPI0033DC873D
MRGRTGVRPRLRSGLCSRLRSGLWGRLWSGLGLVLWHRLVLCAAFRWQGLPGPHALQMMRHPVDFMTSLSAHGDLV